MAHDRYKRQSNTPSQYITCPGNRVVLPCETWIPRIRLRFLSENPWNFAKRIAEAFNSRKACEAGLRYNLYVDCMPMHGIEDVDVNSFQRMSQFSMSTPGLKDKNRYVQELNSVYAPSGKRQITSLASPAPFPLVSSMW